MLSFCTKLILVVSWIHVRSNSEEKSKQASCWVPRETSRRRFKGRSHSFQIWATLPWGLAACSIKLLIKKRVYGLMWIKHSENKLKLKRSHSSIQTDVSRRAAERLSPAYIISSKWRHRWRIWGVRGNQSELAVQARRPVAVPRHSGSILLQYCRRKRRNELSAVPSALVCQADTRAAAPPTRRQRIIRRVQSVVYKITGDQ